MKSLVTTCDPTGMVTRATNNDHRPHEIAADMARVMAEVYRERGIVLEHDLYTAGFVDYEIKLYRAAAAAEATRLRHSRKTPAALAA